MTIVRAGPWDWASEPDICRDCGENPAFVVFTQAGETVYSVWVGGAVWAAASPSGPFKKMAGVSYPGGNQAPIFHDGAFYMTNQKTTEIWTTPKLGANWVRPAPLRRCPAAPTRARLRLRPGPA